MAKFLMAVMVMAASTANATVLECEATINKPGGETVKEWLQIDLDLKRIKSLSRIKSLNSKYIDSTSVARIISTDDNYIVAEEQNDFNNKVWVTRIDRYTLGMMHYWKGERLGLLSVNYYSCIKVDKMPDLPKRQI